MRGSIIDVEQTSFKTGEINPLLQANTGISLYNTSASKLRNVYVDSLGALYQREGMRIIRKYDSIERIIEFSYNNKHFVFVFVALTVNTGKINVIDISSDIYVDKISLALNTTAGKDIKKIYKELDYVSFDKTTILTQEDMIPKEIVYNTTGNTFSLKDFVMKNQVDTSFNNNYVASVSTILPDDGFSLNRAGYPVSYTFNSIGYDWKNKIIAFKQSPRDIYLVYKLLPPITKPEELVGLVIWLEHGVVLKITRHIKTLNIAQCVGTIPILGQGPPPAGGYWPNEKYFNKYPGEYYAVQEMGSTFDQSKFPLHQDLFRKTLEGNNITGFFHNVGIERGIDYRDIKVFSLKALQVQFNPRFCTFHQERLVFGGSTDNPNDIVASSTANIYNFELGIKASDSFRITLNALKGENITNIFSGRDLLIFTNKAEYYFLTDESKAFYLGNISLREVSRNTSHSAKPISLDGLVMFLDKSGSVLRAFRRSKEEATYNGENISTTASHLINDAQRLAVQYAGKDRSIDTIFILNKDGTLAVCSFSRVLQLTAWSLFNTKGFIKDIIVSNNRIFIAVLREGNYYLEVFDKDMLLDGVLLTKTVESTSFNINTDFVNKVGTSDLVSMYGKQVYIKEHKVNRILQKNYTIPTDGVISLPTNAKSVEVGYSFQKLVQTNNLTLLVQGLSIAYKSRSVKKVKVAFNKCVVFGIKINDKVQKEPFIENLNTTTIYPLLSEVPKIYCGGINRENRITVYTEDPFYFELLAIVSSITKKA